MDPITMSLLGLGAGAGADWIQSLMPNDSSTKIQDMMATQQATADLQEKFISDTRMNQMGTMGKGAAAQARQAMDKFRTPISTQVDANALREGGRAAIQAAGSQSSIAKAIMDRNQKNMQDQIKAQLGSQGASPAAIGSIATKIGEGSSNSDYLQQSGDFYNKSNQANIAAREGAAQTEVAGTQAAYQRQVLPYLVDKGQQANLGNVGSTAYTNSGKRSTALGNMFASGGAGLLKTGLYGMAFPNTLETEPPPQTIADFMAKHGNDKNMIETQQGYKDLMGLRPPLNQGNGDQGNFIKGGWRLNPYTGQFEQIGG
jgi:hypothetical protein